MTARADVEGMAVELGPHIACELLAESTGLTTQRRSAINARRVQMSMCPVFHEGVPVRAVFGMERRWSVEVGLLFRQWGGPGWDDQP